MGKIKLKQSFLILLCVTLQYLMFIKISSAVEGISDNEIRIGQFGAMSGPAGVWGSVLSGTGLLFKIVNAEGGIHGKKIKYFIFDDSYNPSMTMQGVKALQEQKNIFAWVGGLGTEPCYSVKNYITKRNIPWISPLAGSKYFVYPNNRCLFCVWPLISSEAKLLCRYAVKTIGRTRIAIIYQNDKHGINALEGATEELKKYNLELVAKIPVQATDAMKISALELKNSQAEIVLVFMLPQPIMRLLYSAKQIDFSPQWMGGTTSSTFYNMYKISHGLWEGMITTSLVDFSETVLLQKYREAFKKYKDENEEWDVLYHAGIALAEPLVEVLRRCGKELTRERLIIEMENLINFKGIGPPISYKKFDPDDPKCRMGNTAMYLIQCIEGGETKRLSDWMTLD